MKLRVRQAIKSTLFTQWNKIKKGYIDQAFNKKGSYV